MGWLKLKGEKLGYYTSEFGTALFAIVTYALALFLLGRRSVVNYRMRNVKKQAAEELKKAHDRFFQFFHLSPEVKTITRLEDGRMLYVNKAYEDFFGIAAKDAIGRTSLELKTITTEQRDEIVRKVKESGGARGIETKFKNLHGEMRDVFIDTEIIDLDDQKCILSNVHDITVRKKTEEALQEKEQLLRSIVDNVGEGLVVMNTEGKYLVVNPVAEKMLREKPMEVKVNALSEKFGLFYPDQVTPLPTSETTVSRSLKGLDTDEMEMFIRNSNVPEGRFIVATGRPIRDHNGKIIAAVSVFRDDTKRRRLQLLLNESEQKLKEVVRTIGEGIVMCNTEGKFILFNAKAEEIVGQGALDVSPQQWPQKYHIYHPDGNRLFDVDELLLVRALKGEVVENMEMLIRNKEAGIEKNLLGSARPVKGTNGEIIAAIADFKDISEVKQLEQLLGEIKDRYNQLIVSKREERD
jgi:PAS domain S-box-containing protein